MNAAGRITALDPDPRRPDAVRIEIDGMRFGAVPRQVVTAENLSVGGELDDQLQERLSAAADVEAAFRTALRALEAAIIRPGRSRSPAAAQGTSAAAVEIALERVAQLGLLDDAAFAQSYVETRAARGRGPAGWSEISWPWVWSGP